MPHGAHGRKRTRRSTLSPDDAELQLIAPMPDADDLAKRLGGRSYWLTGLRAPSDHQPNKNAGGGVMAAGSLVCRQLALSIFCALLR